MRHIREGVIAKTYDVGHARSGADYIPGAYQAKADVGRDGLFATVPQKVYCNVTTYTDETQTYQEDGNLNETNHRAAIQAENPGFDAQQKDKQPGKSKYQANLQAQAPAVTRVPRITHLISQAVRSSGSSASYLPGCRLFRPESNLFASGHSFVSNGIDLRNRP
jgi:hypothetical protein